MLLAKSKLDSKLPRWHPKIGTTYTRVRDMSLQPQPIGPVPEETVRVARAALSQRQPLSDAAG